MNRIDQLEAQIRALEVEIRALRREIAEERKRAELRETTPAPLTLR